MNSDFILEAKNITKIFPGVKALDNVSFKLKRGEVHAIVGENGAGKSTLIQVLCGVHKPESGEIYINGKKHEFNNPLDAQRAGIGIVFQELSLVNELSVAENIFTNRQPVKAFGMISRKQLYAKTREMIETFEENIDPKRPIKYLNIAKQQVIEILKACSLNPQVLILDEPTSSLTNIESEKLFSNIKKMKESGMSIIYISHHLKEIFSIADRATVLRDGHFIKTVGIVDVNQEEIVSLMVGREVFHDYIPRSQNIDYHTPVLEVRSLCHEKHFENISFKLFRGEILGLAGLIGAGRSELAKSIFGLDKFKSGNVLLDGKEIRIRNVKDAMSHKIAYVSEDRKQEGLFLEQTVKDNIAITQLDEFGKGILIDNRILDDYVRACIDGYNIVTPSISQRVRNLSGGNQQKLLLSMWLGIKPKVLIVDEPTKGIDVGAKSEIYEILRKLADTGMAILLISSDLLEILTISDRIIVMRNGMLNGEMTNAEASEESIISKAVGVHG